MPVPSSLRRAGVTLAAVAALAAPLAAPAQAAPASGTAAPSAVTPHHRFGPNVEYVDSLTLPHGMTPFGVPFGGISGLDRIPGTNRYLALSDDRSEKGPARFYTLSIDVRADGFGPRGVRVEAMTPLTDAAGKPFAPKAVDPESIRRVPGGRLVVWGDEGGVNAGIPPKLHVSTIGGREVRQLPIPAQFLPAKNAAGTQTAGVRDNQAFEGVTISPDTRRLTFVAENGLVQDAPAADPTDGSTTRMAVLDRWTGTNVAQYVYRTQDRSFGVSELLQTGVHDYLSVERNFKDGVNTIRVYAVSTRGATDVKGVARLTGRERPVRRTLVADLADSGANPDNVETLAFGPRLRDGSQMLVLNSDDNFSDGQHTVFHLLKIRPPHRAGR